MPAANLAMLLVSVAIVFAFTRRPRTARGRILPPCDVLKITHSSARVKNQDDGAVGTGVAGNFAVPTRRER